MQPRRSTIAGVFGKPFFQEKKRVKYDELASEETIDEESEDDYVNPFTQIKELSKLVKKKDMDEDKVQALVSP